MKRKGGEEGGARGSRRAGHYSWLPPFLVLLIALLLIAPWTEAGPKRTPEKPINLNRATIEELQQLPGVGPAIAERIVRHREKHGPFRRVEELLVIRGISRKKFEQLRPYVVVSGTNIGKKETETGPNR